MVPFVAYLPTEQLGGSGLVAAVVAGIVTGQGAARWFSPEQRLSDELNWRTVELMLEGAVFLVMGLQLKEIVRANIEDHEGLWHGAWLAASAIGDHHRRPGRATSRCSSRRRADARDGSTATRLEASPSGIDEIEAQRTAARRPTAPADRRLPSDARAAPAADAHARVRARSRDLDYYQASPLGWKHGTVIVWAGMRGVVTLAAAQTLPGDARSGAAGVRGVPGRRGQPDAAGIHPAVARAMLELEGSGGSGPTAEEQRRLDDEMRTAAASSITGGGLKRRDGSAFSAELVDVGRDADDAAARRRHDRVRRTRCSNCASRSSARCGCA